MSVPGTSSLSAGGLFRVISRRDHALMRKIHHWDAPRWFRALMILITRGGDGWLWYALGFWLLLFGRNHRLAAVLAGLLASGAGLGIYVLVKRATRRIRPCLVEPNLWAQLLPPDQYSFPSGHTIVAFANAVSVGMFYPAMALPLSLIALLIALSRVLLGMHFLSDVVVGALLGTALGYVAVWFLA